MAAGWTRAARIAAMPLAVMAGLSPADDGAVHARPGECYARVIVPPRFDTHMEKRLKQAATTRVEIVPERFETVEEAVLVRPESERIVQVIPAQYRTVTDRVLVKPAGEVLIEVPAQTHVEEDVQEVRPAHAEWRPGHGTVEKIDDATGAVLCLVEVPAETRKVSRVVVDTPATTRRETIPARYDTVTRQELVCEAGVLKVTVPAEYRKVKMLKRVSPASERSVEVPAVYEDVPVQTLVAPGRTEWRGVLCEINATPAVVRRLQIELERAGFDPGTRSGRLDDPTLAAVARYQAKKGLPSGGVTLETLSALGVSAPAPAADAP